MLSGKFPELSITRILPTILRMGMMLAVSLCFYTGGQKSGDLIAVTLLIAHRQLKQQDLSITWK